MTTPTRSKANALSAAMRTLEAEYRNEGRGGLAKRILNARMQLDSDTQMAARLFDAIRTADPTPPLKPQVEAKMGEA